MKKIPTIILSITYKGVKFIDASNKVCFPQLLLREEGAPFLPTHTPLLASWVSSLEGGYLSLTHPHILVPRAPPEGQLIFPSMGSTGHLSAHGPSTL